MSATMARQGGWVQLEQSNLFLALNMANMAKEGFSRSAIEGMQHLIKKPRGEVREEKKWSVEFPGHNKVKAAIERHPAMVCKNQMDGCLSCQNGTAKYPQTCWKCNGKGAPPPRRATPRPGTPPVPSVHNESSETDGVPPTYVYIHTPLPSARFLSRIACTIQIVFQICWLMMVHPQVSTQSAGR